MLLILPLPLSALEYTRSDRRRRGKKPAAVKKWRRWSASEAVRWLAWRQQRGMVLGLLVFSLLAGIAVIGKGLFTWPVLTLGMGAFCGVAVFLDEQSGAYRFLGEQRFPLGTIWRAKVGFLLFVLLVGALLMLVPSVVAFLITHSDDPTITPWDDFLPATFATRLLGQTIPLVPFLFLWPIYGFAMGSVCGLLFRRPLVALVTAFGLGVIFAGVWAGPMLLGGLQLWPVTGVPIVLLCAGRLLMHGWATDQLASWTTVRRVAVTGMLCVGLTALGLWYRVEEIPDTPEPREFRSFVESLPPPEKNEAGRLIRDGCDRLKIPVGREEILALGRPLNLDQSNTLSGKCQYVPNSFVPVPPEHQEDYNLP